MSNNDFSNAAVLRETFDAYGGPVTFYTMYAGDFFLGEISYPTDEDWVRVTLKQDVIYQVDVAAFSSSFGTLPDPYLELYSSFGGLLLSDDDDGLGSDASLTFSVSTTGVYYLSVSSAQYWMYDTGSYTLSLIEWTDVEPDPGTPTDPNTPTDPIDTPDVAISYDEIAEVLTRSDVAFDARAGDTLTVNLTGLTVQGQQLARWALEAWTNVAGLHFEEVQWGGQISFDDEDDGAYAVTPVYGEIINAEVNISKSWLADYGTSIDSYSFQTYIHEIGHALGLDHAGYYDGSATYGYDQAYANDSWQATIMSYFSQTDNTFIDASYALVATPMLADILAIQSIYGASEAFGGNTVWGAGSNVGGYLGLLFGQVFAEDPRDVSIYSGETITLTIHDTGGRDLLNLSPDVSNQMIDLRPEGISDVLGLRGNLIISRATVIENLSAGSGNDRVVGNDAGNKIWGNMGDDTLSGGRGADRLDGGAGDDRLVGGAGVDTAVFTGRSAIQVDLAKSSAQDTGQGRDILLGIENIVSGNGRDSLRGNDAANVLNGNGGKDQLYGNGGNDRLLGGAGADQLRGGDGADRLLGGNGNDRLLGGNDNDRLEGAQGRDILTGGRGADVFVFVSLADSGAAQRADRIKDFSAAEGDTIDLSGLDGNTNLAGAQALRFIGSDEFSAAGQLRFVQGWLSADTDGDGLADFEIALNAGAMLSEQHLIL